MVLARPIAGGARSVNCGKEGSTHLMGSALGSRQVQHVRAAISSAQPFLFGRGRPAIMVMAMAMARAMEVTVSARGSVSLPCACPSLPSVRRRRGESCSARMGSTLCPLDGNEGKEFDSVLFAMHRRAVAVEGLSSKNKTSFCSGHPLPGACHVAHDPVLSMDRGMGCRVESTSGLRSTRVAARCLATQASVSQTPPPLPPPSSSTSIMMLMLQQQQTCGGEQKTTPPSSSSPSSTKVYENLSERKQGGETNSTEGGKSDADGGLEADRVEGGAKAGEFGQEPSGLDADEEGAHRAIQIGAFLPPSSGDGIGTRTSHQESVISRERPMRQQQHRQHEQEGVGKGEDGGRGALLYPKETTGFGAIPSRNGECRWWHVDDAITEVLPLPAGYDRALEDFLRAFEIGKGVEKELLLRALVHDSYYNHWMPKTVEGAEFQLELNDARRCRMKGGLASVSHGEGMWGEGRDVEEGEKEEEGKENKEEEVVVDLGGRNSEDSRDATGNSIIDEKTLKDAKDKEERTGRRPLIVNCGSDHSKIRQKLEFLGDSVLTYMASGYLLSSFPFLTLGPLSCLRSQMVSNRNLAKVAWGSLGLHSLILTQPPLPKLDMKMKSTQYYNNLSGGGFVADTVETLVGAITVSTEQSVWEKWVSKHILPLLHAESQAKGKNSAPPFVETARQTPPLRPLDAPLDPGQPPSLPLTEDVRAGGQGMETPLDEAVGKSSICTLQELAMKAQLRLPDYKLVGTVEVDGTGTKLFRVRVYVEGYRLSTGVGTTMRDAKHEAAFKALVTWPEILRKITAQISTPASSATSSSALEL